MTVQSITAALNVSGLTPAEKLVLIVLANYANHDMKCWPSQARLARDTCMSERNMVRVFASLEAKGLMVREQRARRRDGARTSHLITLTLHADNLACRDTSHSDKVSETTCQIRQNQHDTMSCKPSLEPSIEPSARASLSASETQARALEDKKRLAADMRALAQQLGARKSIPISARRRVN